MIPENIMGRLVNSAGIEERWLVQLDVLSVYLLQPQRAVFEIDESYYESKEANNPPSWAARSPTWILATLYSCTFRGDAKNIHALK